MKRITISVCLIAIVLALLAGCAPSATTTVPTGTSATQSPTVAKWAPTRLITAILGNSPGSGFDLYARATVQAAKQFMDQEVIIKNISGAGGYGGAVSLYRAKPDGYSMGLLDMERRVADSIVGAPDIDYNKFTYLATCSMSQSAVVVAAKSPYKTIADLVKLGQDKEVRIPCTAPGVIEAVFPQVVGLKKFVYVTGMSGSGEAMLSLVKGDSDCATYPDTVALPLILSGDIRPLMFLGTKNSEAFDKAGIKVPTAVEAGFPELAALGSPRTFAAPPDLPKEILSYWEDVLMKSFNSKQLKDWATTTNNPLYPLNSADSVKAIQDMAKVYSKWSAVLKQYVK